MSYVVVHLTSYQLSTKVPLCPQMLLCTFYFADKPGGQRSAGAPSFIIQEEFDRYTGYWWQPKTKEGESFNYSCNYVSSVASSNFNDFLIF